MPRPTTPTAAADPEITPAIPPRPWTSGVKWLVSAALLFHLTAQFLATWNAAPPASDLGTTLATPFQAYIAAAKLNQGYRFFAPDPGLSHLLRFQVFDAAGKPIILNEFALNEERTEGQLPPRELRVGLFSPEARLLYHRYFMLTEQLYAALPLLPPRLPSNATAQMIAAANEEQARRQQAYYQLSDSFARELLRRFGGASVEMQLFLHDIPRPNAVADGKTLEEQEWNIPHPVKLKYPPTPGAPRPAMYKLDNSQ